MPGVRSLLKKFACYRLEVRELKLLILENRPKGHGPTVASLRLVEVGPEGPSPSFKSSSDCDDLEAVRIHVSEQIRCPEQITRPHLVIGRFEEAAVLCDNGVMVDDV